jgi:mono/diheme cytochrome c family protein
VKICKTMAIILAAFGLAQFRAPAQAHPSTRDGVYTDAQAARGQAMYKKACASCHRETLEGNGTAPPLAGDDFTMDWVGQNLSDLFDRIQTSMPGDNPGSLAPTENADLIAYILKVNKLPAGKNELPTDAPALKQIRFEAAQ